MSVDLEEVLQLDGLPLTHNYPHIARAVGLVAHSVQRLTQDGFEVAHVPLTENDYHGEAAGKPSRGTSRQLAAQCEVIVPLAAAVARRYEDERLAARAREQQAL